MTIHVGVIGAGGMGREHIKNLARHEDVEVVVVADPIEASAQSAAASVGAEATTDAASVASNADLSGVVIASPDETHPQYAIAAMEAGLVVFCEKPLAATLDEAHRFAAAEEANQAVVQLGFMRVFDPAHLQVNSAISELGHVQHLRLVHRNTNSEWVRSLNTIVSQSLIHDIHSARWFSGSDFQSVATHVVPAGDRIAHVSVLGSLASGAAVSIEFAEATYGYDVEVEVTCEHGMAIAAQPAQPVVRRDGSAHRFIGDDWFGRFTEAYQAEVGAWLNLIRHGGTPTPSVADGLAAQRVAAAVVESAETGERVHLGDS